MKELEKTAEVLRKTRPTAVNLFWAIDRVMKKARETSGSKEELAEAVHRRADQLNRRVRRVAADGIIHTVAGGGTGSAPAPATSVFLGSPNPAEPEPNRGVGSAGRSAGSC